MKKLLLAAVIFMFIGGAAHAQLKKGRIVISAASQLSGSFNTIDLDDADESIKINTFSFSPGIGYMITDQITAGASLAFASLSLKVDDEESTTISALTLSGYGKYHFTKPKSDADVKSNSFFPYVTLGLGYVTGKLDSESMGEPKISGLSYGGGAGIDYFLSNSVGLTLGVNYMAANLELKDEDMKMDAGSLSFI